MFRGSYALDILIPLVSLYVKNASVYFCLNAIKANLSLVELNSRK